MRRLYSFFLTLLLCSLAVLPGESFPASAPQGLRPEQLFPITKMVEEAIEARQIPGAVVVIGNQGNVVYRQAFGFRVIVPKRPMTPDTLFDIASLTKVVATTPAILKLVEEGKLKLENPVGRYWPEFKGGGKEKITVRHLLIHYSGLRPALPLKPKWSGYEMAIQKIAREKTFSPPGTCFDYSDINFIVLGELIRRVSGQPLDAYCREHIFKPLGMKDTRFKPPRELSERIAPTKGQPGEVHDPMAERMGGITGHAGLFSTADDLAIFAQTLLNGGQKANGQILGPQMIEKMTLPQSPAHKGPLRGLGWDLNSPFGYDGSDLFPAGSYGHRGYTGTMLWIDPVSQTYVILLTHRVYPNEQGNVEPLRAQILLLVNNAIGSVSPQEVLASRPALAQYCDLKNNSPKRVRPGIEVLVAKKFAPLYGLRVGLVTNHTGIDGEGARTIDLLYHAPGVRLKAIFTPEHGLSGQADGKVPSAKDSRTGLPMYSLYGADFRPTPKMLNGLDALVFDIQDAGVRFYTYITTMGYAMEAAAEKQLYFYVLDRPNPITASLVQGPILGPDLKSFTGYFPLPLRHGMTVGELANMFNVENKMGVKLRIIKMSGYKRAAWFDETGLPWVNPSPNLRSLAQATLYPGVALVEGANVSVGRGTSTPFEIFGSPWMNGEKLAEVLNSRKIPGVQFKAVDFTPYSHRFKNEVCHGVQVMLTDRQALDAAALGIEILSALWKLYPNDFEIEKTLHLVGARWVLQAIKEGQDPQSIAINWQESLKKFCKLREKYLLYLN